MKNCPIKCLMEHPDAKIPERAYGTSAAYDVFACEPVIIPPHSSRFVNIGLRFMIPDGYFVRFWPRSGMGLKHDVFVFPGLLDAGYAGDCAVKLYNCGDEEYEICVGKAVAQVEVGKMVEDAVIMETTNHAEYTAYETSSARGKNGQGSTGH